MNLPENGQLLIAAILMTLIYRRSSHEYSRHIASPAEIDNEIKISKASSPVKELYADLGASRFEI